MALYSARDLIIKGWPATTRVELVLRPARAYVARMTALETSKLPH
jgi:hypothetical protein